MDNPWKCDKCGSEKVSQEWGVMLPMNEDNGWEDGITNSFSNDAYWCDDCDEDCSPIRDPVRPESCLRCSKGRAYHADPSVDHAFQ